jgi:hypothetical protein
MIVACSGSRGKQIPHEYCFHVFIRLAEGRSASQSNGLARNEVLAQPALNG